MSQWLGGIWLVVGFASLIQLLGLTTQSQDVIKISLNSLKIIGSATLTDDQKESQLQKNSQKLLVLFLVLTIKGAIALMTPLATLWLGDRLGWLSLTEVLATTVSPLFIIVSLILTVGILSWQGNNQSDRSLAASSYSQLDRTLHQVAFHTYSAQIPLANLETKLLAQQLANCHNQKPVLITALPRAGTTLLLECCAQTTEFAAHCYRDMPFVLTPCLWQRFTAPFQRQVAATERAHGDGMKINPDSPEALEEIIWHTFWQRHYHCDRIIPWDDKQNQEFTRFFVDHMQKIIYLRRPQAKDTARYISKNNANIARIPLIKQLFPEAIIIVPFRDPLQHANSLLRQHLNFLKIHRADPFAQEYMAAIGHYDFGENLRPIDFDGWLERRQTPDATSLGFWLEYWIASYQYLLQINPNSLYFFDYDALCSNGDRGLKQLAEIVDSQNPQALISAASRIRNPQPKTIDTSKIPLALVTQANQIRDRLHAVSS